MLYKYNEKPCEECDATGVVDENPECGLAKHSQWEHSPCDECDGSGKFDCEECFGEGYIETDDSEEDLECEECDCDGYYECDSCYGRGYYLESCEDCGEEIIETDPVWVGDGFIVCDDCAEKKYDANKCPECDGQGTTELISAMLDNRCWPLADQECSCCGSSPDPEYGIWIFEAYLYDTDGVFFLFLCGGEDGEGHCLETVAEQQDEVEEEKKYRAKVAKACLGDDFDGIHAECAE